MQRKDSVHREYEFEKNNTKIKLTEECKELSLLVQASIKNALREKEK